MLDDGEYPCPNCGEDLVVNVKEAKYTCMFPNVEPEKWLEFLKKTQDDQAHDIHILVDEDPSSYYGVETWSCQSCNYVIWEDESE